MTPNTALASAYQSMDYALTKQAAVLSYMDVFLGIGFIFLACVPFVLFIKTRKGAKVDKEAMAAAH